MAGHTVVICLAADKL